MSGQSKLKEDLSMLRHLLIVAVTTGLAGMSMGTNADNTADQRLQNIEQRLDRLETAPTPSPPASQNSFNPAVSLILEGIFSNLSQDPEGYEITGFPTPAGAEVGPGSRGFSLAESELGIYANIDPYFYGGMNLALTPENEAEVEEAFIQTIALPNGFAIKAGRFFSSIGYLNSQHSHVWDFVDAPLVYQAMFASQYDDDGVQLKWLAPTDTFVEIGGELGRGASFPGSDRDKNGVGAGTLFAHVGGDVGFSNSWRAGLSFIETSPQDREFTVVDLSDNEAVNTFTGHSRTYIVDGVWKYAPNGNPVNTNFKLQAEYIKRHEDGAVTYDSDGALSLTNTTPYDAKQSGWYLQGVYQFMPYWRVGLRTEKLNNGTVDYGANDVNLPVYDYNPKRNSVMIDYSPSEFSRIRLQFASDKAQQGITDKEAFVQYIMSLGAHGAHQY
jgi:hypothetical protein